MRKFARPILVFWLEWLRTLVWIVFFFVAIEAGDLADVFLSLWPSGGDVVNPGGWGGVFLKFWPQCGLSFFFFSFWACPKVSELSERWGAGAFNFGGLNLGSSTLGSFLGWPWVLVLALMSTAFLTSSSKLSSSWPQCFISTLSEEWRPFRKYRIIVHFSRAHLESNSIRMDWKYFRWAA